jgi:hypothetical protein
MNAQTGFDIPNISWAEIDSALAQARLDRAQAMRETLTAMTAWCKRVAAGLRPNRARLPQTGAWA